LKILIIALACVSPGKYKSVSDFLAGGGDAKMKKNYTIEGACLHYGFKDCEVRLSNTKLCMAPGTEEGCVCWELWGIEK
jgi:hypothetical protein